MWKNCRLAIWIASLAMAAGRASAQGFDGPAAGEYQLITPAGKPITVCFGIPPGSGPETPILVVIPGAQRNAAQYRDEWVSQATEHQFIVLALGASIEHFPTEYDYNAGGAVDATGRVRPHRERLFSAIEPMFDDFNRRVGSRREAYSIYGHSAGGGFVHGFLLTEPTARVDSAVAANPAFFVFADEGARYPFGLGGLGLGDDNRRQWFSKPLTVILGDLDLEPRHNPLSNGAEALRQGPHVYARGLAFFHSALVESRRLSTPLSWKLRIAEGVRHSNAEIAPWAVQQLPSLRAATGDR